MAGTYEWYLVILWMQFESWGHSEVVGTLLACLWLFAIWWNCHNLIFKAVTIILLLFPFAPELTNWRHFLPLPGVWVCICLCRTWERINSIHHGKLWFFHQIICGEFCGVYLLLGVHCENSATFEVRSTTTGTCKGSSNCFSSSIFVFQKEKFGRVTQQRQQTASGKRTKTVS